MGWGLVAGLVAGLLAGVAPPAGAAVAQLLHVPSRLLLSALAQVAHRCARLALGQVGARHLLIAGSAGALVVAWRLVPERARVAVTVAGAVAASVAFGVAGGPSRPPGAEVVRGARLWRGGATVLVIDGPSPARLVDGLRVHGVRRVDLVVSVRGAMADVAAISLMRGRVSLGPVVAPSGGRVAGWHPPPDTRIRAGPWVVAVPGDTRPLRVTVARAGLAVTAVGAGR
jgi:hypothetical protein